MEQLKIMIVIIVGFYLIHSINKCIEDKKNNKNEKTIEGFIADRIAVIHDGKIVEMENTEILFNNPQKFITKELLKSILNVNLT